eukprot:COSAG02_NODE_5479_length_4291_cov_5.207777_3_plen_109_part_00
MPPLPNHAARGAVFVLLLLVSPYRVGGFGSPPPTNVRVEFETPVVVGSAAGTVASVRETRSVGDSAQMLIADNATDQEAVEINTLIEQLRSNGVSEAEIRGLLTGSIL